MPAVVEAVKTHVQRQGAAQGRQPGRGRRHRRGDPGRRPRRRRQGRPAPRRDPAVARHRDARRRHDQADRAEHDHPDLEVAGLLDRVGQPVAGRDPRPPGRARVRRGQQDARPVHPRRDPAGSARRAPDRGDVRHRCQRHPRRQGQGPGDQQGAAGPDHRVVDARQERRGPDGPRRPGARRGGPPAARGGRDPQRGRGPDVPGRARGQGPRRQGPVRGQAGDREQGLGSPRVAQGVGHRRGPQPDVVARRDAPAGLDRGLPGRGRGERRGRVRPTARRPTRRTAPARTATDEPAAEGEETVEGEFKEV